MRMKHLNKAFLPPPLYGTYTQFELENSQRHDQDNPTSDQAVPKTLSGESLPIIPRFRIWFSELLHFCSPLGILLLCISHSLLFCISHSWLFSNLLFGCNWLHFVAPYVFCRTRNSDLNPFLGFFSLYISRGIL